MQNKDAELVLGESALAGPQQEDAGQAYVGVGVEPSPACDTVPAHDPTSRACSCRGRTC